MHNHDQSVRHKDTFNTAIPMVILIGSFLLITVCHQTINIIGHNQQSIIILNEEMIIWKMQARNITNYSALFN